LLIKAVDVYNTVSGEVQNISNRFLNNMVKHWGINLDLFKTVNLTISLNASKGSYTIGVGGDKVATRPLRVLGARAKDTASLIEIPLEIYSRQEYEEIPLKTSTGKTVGVYYDPKFPLGTMYVWPIPESSGTFDDIILTVQNPIEDFDAAGDTPDLPQEWYQAIVYNLASVLWPVFREGDPPGWLIAQAQTLLDDVRRFDTENSSISFQPG